MLVHNPYRTRNHERANEFDLKLFRLIIRASGHACKDETRSSYDRDKWSRIERELRRIRPLVRELMHETDIANTR
mgnify:CR=1 FL=1